MGGDGKAFSAIVERHRSRLTTVARRYTHNDTDAQDIVQEALLRASRKLHTYRREARLGTWLHRLVMNSGYDFLNHRSNRENYSLDAGVVEEDYNHLLACTDDRDVDLRLTLSAALRLLRPDQRVALWLIDVAGFDVAEVARHQGVAPGTIKSRRARAKGVLKEAISFSS
ncbi:sigma-70 family RNA polymerase sigma factor [Corynebacterium sp. LK2590]|uniref:RNA polymerase sigma factor n=1 Tax=unclassified Corynebacterium TaxID=2624378 RepID=UPI0034CD9541